MVRVLRAAAVVLLPLLALGACSLFNLTPFPGFLDKTDLAVDLSSTIDDISSDSGVRYDLNVVTSPVPGQPPRVLLLVEPPSNGGGGYSYTGREIFMDADLNVIGQAATSSTMDYFSRPYSYTHDGNFIIGYTILTPQGQPAPPPAPKLTATGLEGFAFTDGTDTYIFATPSGEYTSFDLSWQSWNGSTWSIGGSDTLQIIPPAARPSPTDPDYANLGYQLVGLAYSSGDVTFVLSRPSSGEIVAQRMTLATVKANAVGTVLAADENSFPFSVEADRPALFADAGGLFLIRRDGWAERYPWTSTGALARTGSATRIVGDRSLTREYAFLVAQNPGDPEYMYRFDPSSRILTRYRRWW